MWLTIGDLGLSNPIVDSDSILTGPVGTHKYKSPEIHLSNTCQQNTDIW